MLTDRYIGKLAGTLEVKMDKHTEITISYKIPIGEALIALGIPPPPDDARIFVHNTLGDLQIVVTEIAFTDSQA